MLIQLFTRQKNAKLPEQYFFESAGKSMRVGVWELEFKRGGLPKCSDYVMTKQDYTKIEDVTTWTFSLSVAKISTVFI